MTEALGYIYEIFDRFIEFVFDDMVLFSGVTFGWVIISLLIFGFVLSNLLTIPSVPSVGRTKGEKEHG